MDSNFQFRARLSVPRQIGNGFDTAGIFDLGIGLRWNNWLRFDVIGQYRGAASFSGSANTTFAIGGGALGYGDDHYTARKSELLVLANAYVDLHPAIFWEGYWRQPRQPLSAEHDGVRRWLTVFLAMSVWYAFIVGHVANDFRGVGS